MPILSRSPLSSFNPNVHRFPRSGAITISGVTLEGAIPVSRVVHLYDRATGNRVASTVSDAITGEYVFVLTNTTTVYFVVALDDNYGTAYQALISDRVSGNTTGGVADDSEGPAAPILLIHSDSYNDSVDFVDSSPSGHSLSVVATPHHSTEQVVFGATSIEINASGYLSTPDHEDFDFGVGDFTMDLWFYSLDITNRRLICKGDTGVASGFLLGQGSSGKFEFQKFNPGGDIICLGTTTLSTNQWYHGAAVGYNGDLLIFLNGVLESTTAIGEMWPNTHPLQIGRFYTQSSYDFSGYMDEVRVVKGEAVWTENFTPPTVPYV